MANCRAHATTGERPAGKLEIERGVLEPLPEMATLAPYLRDERRVSRDGYVNWDGAP